MAAFDGATFLMRRYGWKWGVPAYAVSCYVAWGRVHANKHDWWDVLGGAAIGAGADAVYVGGAAFGATAGAVFGGSYLYTRYKNIRRQYGVKKIKTNPYINVAKAVFSVGLMVRVQIRTAPPVPALP